jgi:Flp pilus assembly protein TadD
MSRIDALEAMLTKGQDNALLRYSLGMEHLNAGDAGKAVEHLRRATQLDPDYSAAWKLLGKALTVSGRTEDARTAYEQGIAAAGRKGDKQAGKEMRVFLKRLK